MHLLVVVHGFDEVGLGLRDGVVQGAGALELLLLPLWSHLVDGLPF